VVVCSLSLLIRWAQRARCQAETPLIVLCRFPGPALINNALCEPAVSAVKGGRKGGGAALTPVGTQLVQLYREIEVHAQSVTVLERGALLRLMRTKND